MHRNDVEHTTVNVSMCFQDNQLSKGEMMEHYEVFVGSQATNYGDYMHKHNEFK